MTWLFYSESAESAREKRAEQIGRRAILKGNMYKATDKHNIRYSNKKQRELNHVEEAIE